LWPSEPCRRLSGERSAIDAFPGAGGIARHTGDADLGRRSVGRDLDQAGGVLGEREHEGRLREGRAAQQRLDVKTIGNLDHGRQPVRDLKGPRTRWRREDRQAVRLAGPERVVIGEIVEHVAQVVDQAALDRRSGELIERLGAQILEFEAIALATLLGRRGQVDRNARRVANRQQLLEIGAGRDVGMHETAALHVGWARSASRSPLT
jgi:hypothetical protein